MKGFRYLAAALLMITLFLVPCLAAPEEVLSDAVPDSAKELLSGVDTEGNLADGLWGIVENAMGELGAEDIFSLLRRILCAAILCGTVCALESAVQSPVLRRVTEAAGGAAVFLMAAGGTESAFAQAERAIRDMTAFSEIFTTVYTAASVAAGSPAAAAAKKAAAVFATGLFSELAGRVFLPFCGLYALCRTVSVCMESPGLGRAAVSIRGIMTTGLRLGLTLYAAFITISGVVGAAGDSLLKRGVKGGVAAAVPIIGGALTEACEAIFAGAAAVRNSIGVAGVLVLIATALLPLLKLGAWYAAFRLTAAVCTVIAPGAVTGVADTAAETTGMYLAILAAATAAQLIGVIAGFLSFA
ncbi:MAG: hypothetical protein IJC53_06820 [Clostridia bacterium]|nr:hypothetical protein [Clostridia bacterium]